MRKLTAPLFLVVIAYTAFRPHACPYAYYENLYNRILNFAARVSGRPPQTYHVSTAESDESAEEKSILETPHSATESETSSHSHESIDRPETHNPDTVGSMKQGISTSKHKPNGKDGGAECTSDAECLSRKCFLIHEHGYCLGRVVPKSHRDKKLQEETCASDAECYSGHCNNRECEPDSPVPGKMGRGGRCTEDDECFSGFCILGDYNECAKDSPAEGKVGSYGACNRDKQCFSGVCHDELNTCSSDSYALGKVGYLGYCRTGSDCFYKVCNQEECALSSRTDKML